MTKAHSNTIATSLRGAFELCKQAALRQQRSIERVASLMNVPAHVLYKWLETGRMPAGCIESWEHACGCNAVTTYLAHQAHRLVIDLPRGRATTAHDVQTLQVVLHEATGALMQFAAGRMSADDTMARITEGMEALAWHRANVGKQAQPELEF